MKTGRARTRREVDAGEVGEPVRSEGVLGTGVDEDDRFALPTVGYHTVRAAITRPRRCPDVTGLKMTGDGQEEAT